MKTARVLALLFSTAVLARADLLLPVQDTSSTSGKLTVLNGKAATLAVSATRKSFVFFDLTTLPTDVLPDDIIQARLRIYFPSALRPGDLALHTVTPGLVLWNETTAGPEPAIDAAVLKPIPKALVVAKKFVEIDVTDTVKAWRGGAPANFGFAFTAGGVTSVTLGAKEGPGSGYPCVLDLEIDRPGTIADGSIGAAQLANGAITNPKLANASIIVTAGTGLSGSSTVPLGGTVTLNNTGVLSLTGGGGITASAGTGAITLGSNATSANSAGTLVLRDGAGSFVAQTIVALGAFNMPTTLNAGTGLITQNDIHLLHTFGTQNFFVGQAAGNFTMTGAYNTASGFATFQDNITGADNTASGYAALQKNTSGIGNTASGFLALYLNTSGDHNTAVGHEALRFNTVGAANTASGYQALLSNTTANRNVALGNFSLLTQSYDNKGAAWNSDNVAVGFEALYSNQPTSTTTGYDNTALGNQAMRSNTTGSHNTASGFQAMYFNTTGSKNTATGYAALAFNGGGDANTATGWEALFNNTAGSNNTAYGFQSLTYNTKGGFNTALGNLALLANTTASQNVAIGNNALLTQSFSNGGMPWNSNNVAVGFEALYSNQPTGTTYGFNNTALGTQAMRANTTGFQNTASGFQALFGNLTGRDNTASGYAALASNVDGNGNTASGFDALNLNTSGSDNAAFGAYALDKTTGTGNTGFGRSALFNNASGDNNTAIGYGADVNGGNLTNATAIGAAAIVDASNKVRIGNAAVTVIEAQVGITAISDRNRKENFRPVDGAEVLRKIQGFNLTSWNFIGHDPKRFRHYGPMAQDFYAAFGHDAVGSSGTETTINSGDMAGILMSAVQSLANQNAALKEQLAERDARDRERDARIARLEKMLPPTPAAQMTKHRVASTREK